MGYAPANDGQGIAKFKTYEKGKKNQGPQPLMVCGDV
jgi:hypothetical protein